eukprot:4899035-Prymnesium_polylepis.1
MMYWAAALYWAAAQQKLCEVVGPTVQLGDRRTGHRQEHPHTCVAPDAHSPGVAHAVGHKPAAWPPWVMNAAFSRCERVHRNVPLLALFRQSSGQL